MNIIAVDDEKFALDTLVDSIKKSVAEARVHGFRNSEEARDFVRENGCEIAFLDIKMRGMTGLELARQLKDIQEDINIIFVTGYSEYSLDAFRLYASDYLLKPATPDAVRQALGHLRTPVRPAQTKKSVFSASETLKHLWTINRLCSREQRLKSFWHIWLTGWERPPRWAS